MTTYILDSLDRIPTLTHTAVTVGSYDGVHLGHRAIISRLCKEAAVRRLSSLLITFHPHHRAFFGHDREPFLLTDRDEKLMLLGRTGVEHIVVLPFARPLAGLTAAEFIRDIVLERLGAELFLVGHDQAIGCDQRRGPVAIGALAGPLGVEVASVAPVVEGEEPVSSTRIRAALHAGDLEQASRLLGYPYLLTGRVVHGDARGRVLGYPTANVVVAEPLKLIPAEGVYAVTADIPDGTAKGMLYIGRRPTFGEGPQVIELFLLDYAGDLYRANVRVHLLERLRGDMTFASVEELTRQIRRDEVRTRDLFQTAGADVLDRTTYAP